jgi:hypothetical protein
MGCEDWHLGRKIPAKDRHKGADTGRFCCRIHTDYGTKDLNETTFQENTPEDSGWWKIYVDGASNAKGVRNRGVIITPDETVIEQSIRLDFKTSNNEAEYEAVLAGLNSAKTLGANS